MSTIVRRGVLLAGFLIVLGPGARGDTPAAGSRIHVDIAGLRSDAGQVLCSLFASAEGFPDKVEKALLRRQSVISGRHATCDFADVAAGTYAVAVIHDENSNGRLEHNFIGVPREGVGASNDAQGHRGPPKFEAAALSFAGGVLEIRITIRYM